MNSLRLSIINRHCLALFMHKTYAIFLLCLILLFLSASHAKAQTWAAAYLRGTTNDWQSSAMVWNASEKQWQLTAEFANNDPRLKISRYNNNWNEAYPAQDFRLKDGAGSYLISFADSTKTITATKKIATIENNGLTICFNNASGFANPNIYFWNPNPNNALKQLPAWPGKPMSKHGNFACYTFSSEQVNGINVNSLSVIFSNNGANQTADLQFTGNGCYNNGAWVSLAACGLVSSSASSSSSSSFSSVSSSSSSVLISSSSSSLVISSASSSIKSSISSLSSSSISSASSSSSSSSQSSQVNSSRVYFHNTLAFTTPYLHFYDVIPLRNNSIWPGVLLKNLGAGYYSYDFDARLVSAQMIFNNNGANQTASSFYNPIFNCYSNGLWMTRELCGAPSELSANAGSDRIVNINSKEVLSSVKSLGTYQSAVWTSEAWAGSLVGRQVITPALMAAGEYTVTLTITNANQEVSTDNFILRVVEAEHGLATRPLLAEPLKFPITGTISSGNYRFEKAYPQLDNQFNSPVQVLTDGINDLIYVVDKIGSIFVFDNDEQVNAQAVHTLLNINGVVRNYHEQGLLSMAFDPNFATNGYFYIYYIYGTEDSERAANGSYGDAILERWTVNNPYQPTAVVANSKVELLRVPQPGPDHKGGMMQFHPEEGYLYLSIGDGAYGHSATTSFAVDPRTNNNAQDTSNLLGTMIRIQPLEIPVGGKYYAIPNDNPFFANNNFRGEIWSYGHRNPWRWAFDQASPYTLWETEVGQSGFEEVNLILRGKNYGWPVCEGLNNRAELGGNPNKNCATDFEPPREGYSHPTGFSIIGGFVYRGSSLPELNGKFIFGDYVTKRIWSIYDGEEKTLVSDSFPENIASFGTDLSGEKLLVATYGVEYGGRSTIYKVVDDDAVRAQIPPLLSSTGLFADIEQLIPASGVIEYTLNTDGWFDGAEARHFLSIPNGEVIGFNPNELWALPVGSVLVKHLSILQADNSQKPFTTSVLFKQAAGWQAANYQWNASGTDANLVTETHTVIDSGATPRERTVQASADCGSCHVGSGSKDPLQINTRQLNKLFNYPGVEDNQLSVFEHIGLFDLQIGSADFYDQTASLDDATASLEKRVKSYVDTNCAHCHSSSFMDLRFETALNDMRLINVETTGGKARVRPFDHINSLVYTYQTTDGNRMPKGTRYTNTQAASVFEDWINAVDATLTGLRIKSSSSDVTVGKAFTVSAEETYSNDFYSNASASVIWSSSDDELLDVKNLSGTPLTLIPLKAGRVTLTANNHEFSASYDFIINDEIDPLPPLSSIVIAPNLSQIADSQQLVAYGINADNSHRNLYGKVSWSVTTGNAVINQQGFLTRTAVGDIGVSAQVDNILVEKIFNQQSADLTLRFYNANSWAAVNIYLWRVVNGVNQPLSAWPGIAMAVNEGGGWFSHTIPASQLNNGTINVIFTNGQGAQTADQLNIKASSSYNNGVWTALTASTIISRLSVIAATTVGNVRDFPAGTVVEITANEAPYGTRFTGWTGDGLSYVFTDPQLERVSVVIPTQGLSLQALFEEDKHVQARSWYAAQCSSCHGGEGEGATANVLNKIHETGYWQVSSLAQYINDFMPMGNESQCVGTSPGDCAYALADMMLDNAWDRDTCSENNNGSCSDGALDDRNLRLLTREEYLNSVRDIFAINFSQDILSSVPVDGRNRNFDTASFLVADYDRAVGYSLVAEVIANQVITQKGFMSLVGNCTQASCVIENLGKKIFRRPLSQAEKQRFSALYSSADGGRLAVQSLLMSPHFLYRSEMGQAIAGSTLYRLSAYEVASLLSYTFWATTPDEQLLTAAEANRIDIAQQVTRLLNDPRAERGLRRFASGWLVNNQYGFAGISSLSLVDAFKEETVMMVLEAIRENKPFNSLLTANYTYVNQELAAHYGIDGIRGNQFVKANYAQADQRSGAGLLGHGSFLASRTSTINPAPIKRGVYVREVLMCQEFPPPAAADFNVVFKDSDSNRDATSRHTSDPACASCHQFIDGVGFGFEAFGSNALFRTIETLGNGTTRAIDASGAIKSLYSPETTMDPNSEAIAYQSIPELAGLIADSGQASACYSRQFYRYVLGRTEVKTDEEIIRTYSSPVRNGGGMRDMLIDFATAEAFVLRR